MVPLRIKRKQYSITVKTGPQNPQSSQPWAVHRSHFNGNNCFWNPQVFPFPRKLKLILKTKLVQTHHLLQYALCPKPLSAGKQQGTHRGPLLYKSVISYFYRETKQKPLFCWSCLGCSQLHDESLGISLEDGIIFSAQMESEPVHFELIQMRTRD